MKILVISRQVETDEGVPLVSLSFCLSYFTAASERKKEIACEKARESERERWKEST